MRLTSRMAALALIVSAILLSDAATAVAEDCPAKSAEMEDIIDAIKAAPGCDAAMKVFGACEFGASGDVQLGAAVEKICEANFLPRLKTAQRRAYQREMGVCDRKYRNQSGTMSLSFTAFCRAEVAQRYARKPENKTRK
jgi:hypothetical protein